MCRWVTLISNEDISLSDVVLAPSNSLIIQSRDATFHPGYGDVNNAALNADGFGVGWYHSNIATIPTVTHPVKNADGSISLPSKAEHKSQTTDVPVDPKTFRAAAVFKDVFPAWNNMNLRELCMSTSSNCIMAHVRAASVGTGVSQNNCHPFKAGRLLFCHNGRLFNFQSIRRRFLSNLSDEAFLNIRGTTDSEAVFGLILTNLANDGHGSPFTQQTSFGSERLVAAMKKTLHQLERILEENKGDEAGYSTCNYSLTDGETMVVTRYCDQSPEIPPPSLYFAYGSTLKQEFISGEPIVTTQRHAVASSTPWSHFNEEKKEVSSSDDSAAAEENADDSGSDDFEEAEILLHRKESKPGVIMADVNADDATFVVCSNPLTSSLSWHKMPRNSIMWCTRGQHPELRLLNRRSRSSMTKVVF